MKVQGRVFDSPSVVFYRLFLGLLVQTSVWGLFMIYGNQSKDARKASLLIETVNTAVGSQPACGMPVQILADDLHLPE